MCTLFECEENKRFIIIIITVLSYSPYRPGAFHPILHIILVQFILFFILCWCKIASPARGIESILPPKQQR